MVLGGDSRNTPPTEFTEFLPGTSISNVIVYDSKLRSHCAFAAANFVGLIQAQLCAFQTFVFQPYAYVEGRAAPALQTSDSTIRVVNVSQYTAVFGREYEQDFETESDPMPSEALALLRPLTAAAAVLFVLAIVLHGPRLYWYTQYKLLEG